MTDIGAVAGTIPAPNGETNMETSLAYTIAEACTLTRTGKTALYEAIKTGELRAREAWPPNACASYRP